jgi:hypothetical protein
MPQQVLHPGVKSNYTFLHLTTHEPLSAHDTHEAVKHASRTLGGSADIRG